MRMEWPLIQGRLAAMAAFEIQVVKVFLDIGVIVPWLFR